MGESEPLYERLGLLADKEGMWGIMSGGLEVFGSAVRREAGGFTMSRRERPSRRALSAPDSEVGRCERFRGGFERSEGPGCVMAAAGGGRGLSDPISACAECSES